MTGDPNGAGSSGEASVDALGGIVPWSWSKEAPFVPVNAPGSRETLKEPELADVWGSRRINYAPTEIDNAGSRHRNTLSAFEDAKSGKADQRMSIGREVGGLKHR